MTSVVGKVMGIAVRTGPRSPMHEIDQAEAAADGGLVQDIKKVSVDRGITLISARQWRQVLRELGVELPWHTRRANVLIDADGLGGLIGRTLRLGGITVQVTGETRPCELMNELQPGLREALRPDCRGGVTCRVVSGGSVRVGDELSEASTP